jgi:hypothetical protein
MVNVFQYIQLVLLIQIVKINKYVRLINVLINVVLLDVQVVLFVSMENVFHYVVKLFVQLDLNVLMANVKLNMDIVEKMINVRVIKFV